MSDSGLIGPDHRPVRWHQPTIDYVARRSGEGRTKEIIRCLKRYVAREVFHLLPQSAGPEAGALAHAI